MKNGKMYSSEMRLLLVACAKKKKAEKRELLLSL